MLHSEMSDKKSGSLKQQAACVILLGGEVEMDAAPKYSFQTAIGAS